MEKINPMSLFLKGKIEKDFLNQFIEDPDVAYLPKMPNMANGVS